MNLKEIIKNIDRSEIVKWPSLENIKHECGIYDDLFDRETCKLNPYYFQKWLCTDTWVGGQIYFLGDTPVCMSFQTCRKGEEKFKWISHKLFEETRGYLLTLIDKESITFDLTILTSDELNEDLGNGYTLTFANSFLVDTVIEIDSDQTLKILDTYREEQIPQRLNVEYPDGTQKDISTNKVMIPFNK